MIPISDQIAIFEEAKARYLIYQNALNFCSMCWSLNITLKDKDHKSSIFEIDDFLPTFTYENVCKLASQYNFEEPKCQLITITYWWDIHNAKPRISAFDALVDQLKRGI